MNDQNEKIFPIGLYSSKQRLKVFLFIALSGIGLAGVYRLVMLFFHSYAMYSNIIAIIVLSVFVIIALVSLFMRNLNGFFKITLTYILPAFAAFIVSLTLFIVLVEQGAMNIDVIVGWFI